MEQLTLFDFQSYYFDNEDAAKTFVETFHRDERYECLSHRIYYAPTLAHWVAEVDYVER